MRPELNRSLARRTCTLFGNCSILPSIQVSKGRSPTQDAQASVTWVGPFIGLLCGLFVAVFDRFVVITVAAKKMPDLGFDILWLSRGDVETNYPKRSV